jgi:RNase P subunit RPR2
MSNQWILACVIVGALFAVVGVVRLLGRLKLKRMRALTCPDCHRGFEVPSLTGVRWWMTRDSGAGMGFYLHCGHCGADYRFTDRYELLGREQKAT